ncbi:type II toxin-antitoxin system HicB family antitoxin [Halorubrum ezzemoulense]|uniref:type II toxin-antitoxin system HicB family antitoxin n=1 Tax=Halorubrum ezzemoulense TaxID=337243 RepID=UPI00232FFE65|nr:type II toxin-antitoxin system HicB family antitoxin [Halorubrum ezzemoulense]MDB9254167.1 type II toxin-antitoxin system HicB family antitoxin [Halorubrum ezzemoulense]MDB9257303.1 type II toxin-antitoxin system HicB family antitoxin [Halorubrum ezzemoulense]MDB9277333.1 type II toxin-antitoxin system HicB family antitoxin [Halorubrum ezzemoulense]
MSTETSTNDDVRTGRTITLTQADDGWWVARDEATGVASQGETRQDALENLDEAVALHKGETGDSVDNWEEEKEVLEELGIDPDEVQQARDEHDGLPEFMQ